MTVNDRIHHLIDSLTLAQLRALTYALWAALMHVKPTNQTAAEWADWLELMVPVRNQERRP